jgi:ABC-type molybdate transport system ATPase subunit
MSLGSSTLVLRACRTKYACGTAPSWSTIMLTAKQFEKTGSVINLQARKRNTSPKHQNAKISPKKSCQKNLHYRSDKQAR